MKRFRFSLRPVAVLRAYRETRASEAFAAAVHHYVQSEEVLADTRQRVSQFAAAMCHGRGAAFNPLEEVQTLAGYRREAQAEIEAERQTIAARDEMERRRNEYLEAHRNLEILNRLEGKARGHHQRAVRREEQAEFDEFATRRATRRSAHHEPLHAQ